MHRFWLYLALASTNPLLAVDLDSVGQPNSAPSRIDTVDAGNADFLPPQHPGPLSDSNPEIPTDSFVASPSPVLPSPSDSTVGIVSDTLRPHQGKAAGSKVIIRGKGRHRRKEVSSNVLTRAEANAVAATAQDPLRALPTLPGVTVASDLSVRPIVRGGDQAETSVELDGVPLLMPYHFGSIFSVFHREGIEEFQLYSGVAPARAEGALSGTILARSRSAPLDTTWGGLDLSFLRGSGWVGVPLIPQRMGLWISGQSMWYDWTVKRALDLASLSGGMDRGDVEEFQTTTTLPTNWDLQAGLTTRLTENITLDLSGFVAKDRYKVLERENICLLDGREVPCDPYQDWTRSWDDTTQTWSCLYSNGNGDWTVVPCGGNSSTKTIYDTSADVELSNWMVSSRLEWSPDPDLQFEAVGAFQKVAWDVRLPGDRTLVLMDSAQNTWRPDRLNDSSRFDWRRTSLDLGLSVRKKWTSAHTSLAGAGGARGREIVHTKLDRTLAHLILGTTGNPLEFLGYYNEKEVLVLDGSDSRYLTMSRVEDLAFPFDASLPRERENLWLEHRWDLDQGTRVRMGARLARHEGKLDVPNPRLQIQHEVGPSDIVGLGVALHSQSELPFEWRLAASEPLVSQKAWVGILEWEHTFAPGWRATLSGWGKIYRDLASAKLERYGTVDSTRYNEEITNWVYTHKTLGQDFFQRFTITFDQDEESGETYEEARIRYEKRIDSMTRDIPRVYDSLVPDHVKRDIRDWLLEKRLRYASTGEGWATGLEASLRYQPTSIWNGWASAEWTHSRRKDREDGIWYPFGLERPWKFSWVNAVKLDRAWELSVRYTALGGNPYTPFKIWDEEFANTKDKDTSIADTAMWIGERNSGNLAAYQRLDLRLSRSGTLFGKPSVFYYEIWNALNEPNAILRDAETDRFRWISLNLPFPVVFLGCEVRF